MAVYSVEGATTATATGNILGFRAGASDLLIYEIFLAQVTAVATRVRLARASAVGTASATITPVSENVGVASTAAARAETAWSSAPTAASVGGRRGGGPAGIGNFVIWQFADGLYVPANGLILVVALATVPVLDFHAVMRE